MPAPLPPTTLNRIRAHFNAHAPTATIHATTGVSVSKINKMRRLFLETGDIVPAASDSSPPKTIGRPKALSDEHEEKIFEYLRDFPDAGQAELCWWLFEECDLMVDQSTVSRLLKRRGWGRRGKRGEGMGVEGVVGSRRMEREEGEGDEGETEEGWEGEDKWEGEREDEGEGEEGFEGGGGYSFLRPGGR